MAKSDTTSTAPAPAPKKVEPKRPTILELTAARVAAESAQDVLASATRQLRSAHSFNDADERAKRIAIAEERFTKAKAAAEAATARFEQLKADAS